jgi:outer membrane translocation and assembly module TamA
VKRGQSCKRYYDVKREVATQDGTSTQRVTQSVTAHEQWTKAATDQQLQSISFEIPETAPFSDQVGPDKYVSGRIEVALPADKA